MPNTHASVRLAPLEAQDREAFILDGVQGSDHCPVGVELSL